MTGVQTCALPISPPPDTATTEIYTTRNTLSLHDALPISRRNVRADCVVSADKALFDDIVTGKTHAVAAALRDELNLEGDVRLVVALQRLFPGPARSRRRRRATTSTRGKK